MRSLIRVYRMFLQSESKNRGRGLGCMRKAGDGHGIEQVGDTETTQHIEQPRIEVGDDAQFVPTLFQFLENTQRLRIEPPPLRIVEGVKDLLEIVIEPLEYPDAVKHVMDDVEPPESFATLDLGWVAHREDRRRSLMESALERFLHGGE